MVQVAKPSYLTPPWYGDKSQHEVMVLMVLMVLDAATLACVLA
jgi:hypothetical protein